jgi:hypothetical protein
MASSAASENASLSQLMQPGREIASFLVKRAFNFLLYAASAGGKLGNKP